MKAFIKEFKEFALKGNVMDMAVGVIIGGAFGNIVTALTNDFINPLIASIGGTEVAGSIQLPWVDYTGLGLEERLALSLNYGDFITAIINFVIMAFVLFSIIKAMNNLAKLGKKNAADAEAAKPTVKTCPYCCSEINIKAVKCPHCGSDLKD